MHPRVFIADKLLLCTWFPERQAGKDCLWFGNGKHAFRLLFLHNCSEMCLCGGCLQAASPPERIITVSVEACGRRMRRRLGRRRRYFGGGIIWCLYKSALCACQAFFFAFSQLFWGVFTWIYGAGWCYLCVGVKWGQWIDVTQLSPIKLRSPLGWNIWLKETLSHFYTILSSPQVFEKKKKVWLRSKPRGSGIIAHLSSSLNSPVQSRLSCHVQNFLCVQ